MNDTVKSCSEYEAARLRGLYGHLDGAELLEPLLRREFQGRIVATSSFGAEAAVLLSLIADIDPRTPVVFLDTLRLFGETLRYQRDLSDHLGLEDVRVVHPDSGALAALDPDEMLFARDPDACCRIRKVDPLGPAIEGFDAWITGRKQMHGGSRASLEVIEAAEVRIKVNPLARWDANDIKLAFLERDLPRHPLVAEGFLSLGCMPCTERVASGSSDIRGGRWAGRDKSECGIHLPRGQ
ncbi:phosphoadenylyl-sulfate reductase [Oceanibacterium hippocampi]|uniref:Adenosine 5'-phosphosulfate reductase n=1 Tax=Oceanibacterium hippocampi TaxID=745714 RepID=A0A1Y5R6I6_9PROT|nr:phosphoadenylyl-sulfate reductase [Oceanibacterium hippocampi]SLN10342.1 Phosphoadenosine phosphosulfate reductase [Oceanibacterium hippocampi]